MNFEYLQDTHVGETCIIAGNGVSLKSVPHSFLYKYPSFGTNRIYLPGGFTPTYYVCVNPLVLEQSVQQINEMKSGYKFVAEAFASKIVDSYGLVSTPAQLFSFNPCAYVYEGFTVTFVCMQLAFFMGYDPVLLVGVDHRYKTDGLPNQETVWKGEDPNHFNPDYFKDTKWNNPDLARSEQAYKLAEKAFRENGRHIYNLTKDTALDVFKKEKINKWA